jgi:uncharacterized protein (TIGR00645 family)
MFDSQPSSSARKRSALASFMFIGISSIHLLKTFINAKSYDAQTIIAQTCIHVVFLLSAMAIAYTDRIMMRTQSDNKHH